MPARPEATRARLHMIADMLARERGSPEDVTAADLRGRLNDTHGQVGRWHAEWLIMRTTGDAAPVATPGPARPESDRDQPPTPAPGRGRPRKTPKRSLGSFLGTDAEERADERRARMALRQGQAQATEASRRGDGDKSPDLSTAAGRLRAAVAGTARPGAPKRRRVVPADWKGAANPGVARAVATWLCDIGRPARSREIYARFLPKPTYEVSVAAANRLVVRALEGSRIVLTGGEWWFEGEEKPRKIVGDSFEELLLEAARETLREERRPMSAPEIEAAHGNARSMVRDGYLGEALRREAAKFEAAEGGTAGRRTARDGTKKTAARAAVLDGGIEKVGEAYRWVPGEARRR
jgi:hypothetical protein